MISGTYRKAVGVLLLVFVLGMMVLSGCTKRTSETAASGTAETEVSTQAKTEPEETLPETPSQEEKTDAKTEQTGTQKERVAMTMYINDMPVDVDWDENVTVEELRNETTAGDISIDMSMYGGWEQVGSLGKSYTRNDTHFTAECGDIVLYSGNQIVVFYGSNSWDYTHLGKIKLSEDEVQKLLGTENVILKLTAE